MKFDSTQGLCIRVFDRNATQISQKLAAEFPEAHIGTNPIAATAINSILVTFDPPTDEDIGQYGWIHSTGAGLDAIYQPLLKKSEPPVVTRTLANLGQKIGEYCLSYTLMASQNLDERRSLQNQGVWDSEACAPEFLFDKTLVVVGTGQIGQAVARVMKPLVKRVVGLSRLGASAAWFDEVKSLLDIEDALSADIVVITLPKTVDTINLISAKFLSTLDRVLLLNVGRGSTLDLQALREALAAGNVKRAVLDVFPDEPLGPTHWAWSSYPEVIVTPHVAGLTTPDDVIQSLAPKLRDLLSGGTIGSDLDFKRGY